jgi:hypothetical protein
MSDLCRYHLATGLCSDCPEGQGTSDLAATYSPSSARNRGHFVWHIVTATRQRAEALVGQAHSTDLALFIFFTNRSDRKQV